MFSKNDHDKTISSDRKLIYSILSIQLSNFKLGDMRSLSNDDHAALKKLVIKIGNKLIKNNLEEAGELNLYPVAKLDFANIINTMSKPEKKFCFIRYAAQLIQYYLLIFEQQCPPQHDLQAFQQFLDNKKVVNANMNLYIIEHQVLIIYRELFELENDIATKSLSRADLDAKLALINLHLQKSREIIDGGKIDAPYNVFIFYLGFIINYSCVRVLQISSSLQLSFADTKEISQLKEVYEELANNDLKAIDSIKTECEQHKITYANGYEFSFGQDIFKKFGAYCEKNSECLSTCSKL